MLNRIMKEDAGVLTFEWILLVTILVIGVIAGLSAVRDALTVELSDVAQAAGKVDQGYDAGGVVTQVTAAEEVDFIGAVSSVNVIGTGTTTTEFTVTTGEGNEFRFVDGATEVTVDAK